MSKATQKFISYSFETKVIITTPACEKQMLKNYGFVTAKDIVKGKAQYGDRITFAELEKVPEKHTDKIPAGLLEYEVEEFKSEAVQISQSRLDVAW